MAPHITESSPSADLNGVELLSINAMIWACHSMDTRLSAPGNDFRATTSLYIVFTVYFKKFFHNTSVAHNFDVLILFFGVGDGPPRHARQMLYNRTLLQVQRFLFSAIADVKTQIKTVAQISLIGFYSSLLEFRYGLITVIFMSYLWKHAPLSVNTQLEGFKGKPY